MRPYTKVILFWGFCFIYLSVSILAQAPDTLWTKTFGGSGDDQGYSVQQTSDGGYIIVGTTNSSGAGLLDILLIKTDVNGDTMWTKTFGGSDDEYGLSIQQTSDEGYIVTGYTKSYGSGSWDVWLIKTDVNGDTMWTKTFGGGSDDVGTSVQQTSDSGYIITGATGSSGAGDFDVWLIKTNVAGDTLWTRTFGGNNVDGGLSVQQTFDEGYIISGYTLSFGSGGVNVWLIRTDVGGNALWTQTFGGNNDDYGNFVQQTSDGGYIITGAFDDAEALLLKTNANGATEWYKSIHPFGNRLGFGNSVQQTMDGGYICVGYGYPLGGVFDAWLLKTNSNGIIQWESIFGGSNDDWGNSVQQTTDGGYIITGYTESYGNGSKDVWLIKLDEDITYIDDKSQAILRDYILDENYPNPFNPSTKINYQLPKIGFVTLRVYDLLGNEIVTLVNQEKKAGSYTVEFNAVDLPSGIYFYQLQAGEYLKTKKMVLLK